MAKKRTRPTDSKPVPTTDSKPVPSANIGGGSLSDWIAALAHKEAGEATTKEERVEKRQAKKLRRHERTVANAPTEPIRDEEVVEPKKKKSKSTRWELALRVANMVKESAATVLEGLPSWKSTKTYEATTTPQYGKRNWNEESIQPRRRDYGGIGLARPSMFLSLDDPAFAPKLEEEFAEHIPGFFGKQRTKAMKKQLDSNMLWRRLADKKTGNVKVNGKKLANMSPDERVEAMIQSGML